MACRLSSQQVLNFNASSPLLSLRTSKKPSRWRPHHLISPVQPLKVLRTSHLLHNLRCLTAPSRGLN
ncbi:hypothetical protein RvY_13522 [Ramazzottius varieornatus]|uniref:Uncharacterized protein n=1 Tax=Ramazzottius varieornatus TaxID=947166 RepID=A0A1D1VN66_RAMVA|nr:hypothetical protein RvY_13522 [Ramazzottius varieornatus]